MSQNNYPIKTLPPLTDPLPLRSIANPMDFNASVERTLQELQLALNGLNDDFIIKTNAVAAEVNQVLPNLPEVVAVGANIQGVIAIAPHVDQIDAVAQDIVSVKAVGDTIEDVQVAAANMAAIQAAPGHAQTASDKAAEAAASEIAAKNSATAAAASGTAAQESATAAAASGEAAQESATVASASEVAARNSATAAAASETNAASSEAHSVEIEYHVEQMRDNLMDGATPEPLPGSAMRRDELGRTQVEAPEGPKDAANRDWTDERISMSLSSLQGGLKTPVQIDLESQLPDPATAEKGDYYVISNMDVTSPGYQGRAWYNPDVSTTAWQTVTDRIQTPDGVTLVIDNDGKTTLSDTVKATLDKADNAIPDAPVDGDLYGRMDGEWRKAIRTNEVNHTYWDLQGLTTSGPALSIASFDDKPPTCQGPDDDYYTLFYSPSLTPRWRLVRYALDGTQLTIRAVYTAASNPNQFTTQMTSSHTLAYVSGYLVYTYVGDSNAVRVVSITLPTSGNAWTWSNPALAPASLTGHSLSFISPATGNRIGCFVWGNTPNNGIQRLYGQVTVNNTTGLPSISGVVYLAGATGAYPTLATDGCALSPTLFLLVNPFVLPVNTGTTTYQMSRYGAELFDSLVTVPAAQTGISHGPYQMPRPTQLQWSAPVVVTPLSGNEALWSANRFGEVYIMSISGEREVSGSYTLRWTNMPNLRSPDHVAAAYIPDSGLVLLDPVNQNHQLLPITI